MARILWNSGIATTKRTVVANFVPGNFDLFRQNPWQALAEPWGSAEPRLQNTDVLDKYECWKGKCVKSVLDEFSCDVSIRRNKNSQSNLGTPFYLRSALDRCKGKLYVQCCRWFSTNGEFTTKLDVMPQSKLEIGLADNPLHSKRSTFFCFNL